MDFSPQAPPTAEAPFSLRGTGPDAVLLIHGFTSGPRSMRPWADALAAAGLTVSLPLLPGHGTSWHDLAGTPHTAWSRAVLAEFDALQRGHRHVFVAGLSMGGALALQLAARRDVAGVVVVNPGLTFADPAAHLAGVLRHVVASVPAIANDIALPDQDEGAYERTPVAAVHQLAGLFRDTRRALPRITAPVLVYRSRTDHVVPESSVRALRAGFSRRPAGLPPLTVVTLEASYHVATLDHDARRIFDGSIAFFRTVAGAGRG
jgi:carboxylesterase